MLLLVSACGSTPKAQLNGTFSGSLYGSGYYLGALAIDVRTSGSRLSGAGCFAGVDDSLVCNDLDGSISGSNVRFSIGLLNFSARHDSGNIDGTYSGNNVSGTFSLSRYVSGSAVSAAAEPGTSEALELALQVRDAIR
jgi:hypothetical protein